MEKIAICITFFGLAGVLAFPLSTVPKVGEGSEGRNLTLYACVISNQSFTVGADNPKTGLFYSTDGGNDWHHLGWKNGRPFGMAADTSTKPITLYLSAGNGVHKSTDGGKTWAIKTSWEITEVQKITLDPTNPRILYIATPYGVWKSNDAGETWVRKNRGLRDVVDTFITSVVVDREKNSRVLIGTENGVFESQNGGDSWKPLALQGKRIRTLIDLPMEPGVLLAGTEDHGIFKSRDAGRTWQELSNGLEHKTIYALAFDRNNRKTLYAGGFKTGVYRSTDGGLNWRRHSHGLTTTDVHGIVVNPNDSNIVYAATVGGGVFKSEDGGVNWHYMGLESCQVWDIKFY